MSTDEVHRGLGILDASVIGPDLLAEVASFTSLVSYGLVHVAVIRLRRIAEGYDPAFRIPGPLYPLVSVAGGAEWDVVVEWTGVYS